MGGLTCTVDDPSNEIDSSGQEYTSYRIVTKYESYEFTARRRFREFQEFHQDILTVCPNLSHQFPQFPLPKQWFGRFNQELVKSRQEGLQYYLNEVLRHTCGDVPHIMRKFLELWMLPLASAPAVAASTVPEGEALQRTLRKAVQSQEQSLEQQNRGRGSSFTTSGLAINLVEENSKNPTKSQPIETRDKATSAENLASMGGGGSLGSGNSGLMSKVGGLLGRSASSERTGASSTPPEPKLVESPDCTQSPGPASPTKEPGDLQAEMEPLKAGDTTIVVVYRLPCRVRKTDDGWKVQWNGDSGLGASLVKGQTYIPKSPHKSKRRATPNSTSPAGSADPNAEPQKEEKPGVSSDMAADLSANEVDPRAATQGLNGAFGWNASVGKGMRTVWVGCLNVPVAEEDQMDVEEALAEYNCHPVFLDSKEKDDHYIGFCRGYLRPSMHNIVMMHGQNSQAFREDQWRAYFSVNKKFADKVIEIYETGDMIWVHDYHLLLLPSFIMRKVRTASIGLFMHGNFPSSEVFRCIAVRDELLKAMLNCDLIGFLLFEYARNFLTCCKRMLGLQYEFKRGGFLGVEYQGRHVMVQVSGFGIEPTRLDKYYCSSLQGNESSNLTGTRAFTDGGNLPKLEKYKSSMDKNSAEWSKCISFLQEEAKEKQLVASIDVLDRFKGTPLKLLAFELLLQNCPQYRGKVLCVQICLESRNDVPLDEEADAQQVRADVLKLVERINDQFPGHVHYEQFQGLSIRQRIDIWRLSRCVVFSALREAINLHPMEYVYCRTKAEENAQERSATKAEADKHAGVMVISEFCGSSRVLNGALLANPWNTDAFQKVLDEALRMSPQERHARHQRDQGYIASHTSSQWAERFLQDLKSLKKKEEDSTGWTAVGFGLTSFRMVGMGLNFGPLDVSKVLMAYRSAQSRAIFLDWGGTLSPLDLPFYDQRTEEDKVEMPQDVLAALAGVCKDQRNMCTVLSGLGCDRLQQAFGTVPGLDMAAEHGFYLRLNTGSFIDNVPHNQWVPLIKDFDNSWREVAEAIMQLYTQRTTGSYIQKKGSSLVWKFDEADPEYGGMMAKELNDHLLNVLSSFDVTTGMGKGYLEVQPKGINKGVMVECALELMKQANKEPDFILCIGDDSADEFMFSALENRYSGERSNDANVFTCTVGRKPSTASFFLNTCDEVLEVLKALASHSSRRKSHASMNDLSGFKPQHGRSLGRSYAESKSPYA